MIDEKLRELERRAKAPDFDLDAVLRARVERVRAGGPKFTQHVRFLPARDDRPKQEGDRDGGVAPAEIHLVLEGPLGLVSYGIMTPWLPSPLEPGEAPGFRVRSSPLPTMVLGMVVHRPAATGRDCTTFSGTEFAPAGCVFQVLSGLTAGEIFEELVKQGDQVVWHALERTYFFHFEGEPE